MSLAYLVTRILFLRLTTKQRVVLKNHLKEKNLPNPGFLYAVPFKLKKKKCKNRECAERRGALIASHNLRTNGHSKSRGKIKKEEQPVARVE